MKKGIRTLIIIGVGFGVALAGIVYKPAPLVRMVIEGVVTSRAAVSEVPEDRFELLFCGTGSPNRTPSRGQPCLAAIAGGRLFLFDAGEGAIGALTQYNAPLPFLDTIFLTHLHSDHISGVGEVLHNTWLFGRTQEVEVVGPPGTTAMLEGFSLAYEADILERQHLLGQNETYPELVMGNARDLTVPSDEMRVVYDQDGVTVEAFRVEHGEWFEAYGYRMTYAGKTVVISGDTRKTAVISSAAKGANLLIHEAVNVDAMDTIAQALKAHDMGIPSDRIAQITAVHTSTLEVAELARDGMRIRLAP